MSKPGLPLTANQVLVTVGTPCNVSAVGTTETHRALATGNPQWLGFAAFDAGLVDIDLERSTVDEPCFVDIPKGNGSPGLSLGEIEARFGPTVRANMGIRELTAGSMAPHVLADIGAPLPHDLEHGGLRRLAGLSFTEIRQSAFADMFGLFDDDPRLGPSLQSQLFLYAGLGALAALPGPLSRLVEPHRFRVAAGCAFPGLDSFQALSQGMQPLQSGAGRAIDKLAYRLSAALNTHGPALLSAMLSPSFSLSKVKRHPALLDRLVGARGLRRVPQAPLVSSGACASALLSLCDIAPQLVGNIPGAHNPHVVLLTAADAALAAEGRVLEGFGLGGALVTRQRLAALNEGRSPEEQRSIAECLCPFDVDGQGTVVGHAGSGVLVTTLDFALRNFLDITSLVVGFGQSSESGGKGHFAGVGFGGENALIMALEMAASAHGFGVDDFRHLVAHATGTRTNSRTDLACARAAREAARELQGFNGRLSDMTVSAPKAIGDGHSMGETGLKAIGEAIQYVLGHTAIGIPTLRRLDDQLDGLTDSFRFSREPVRGDEDGGALVATQGFGGYDAAIALRSANPETLKRYSVEGTVLQAYLERWPELRKQRAVREARYRRLRGAARRLAEEHCWSANGE